MNLKKLLSLTLALLMMVSVVGCSSNKTTTETAKTDGAEVATEGSNTLKVGMECDYAPYNWTQTDDSNGGYAIGNGEFAGGYDVEVAKKLAESMGKELVIVKTVWDGLTLALTSGKIDLIVAGMSPTADRAVTINFSDPYYVSEYVMVIKKGGDYENASKLEDFSNAKISAQLNTFNYELVDQIPDVEKQQALETFSALMVALESGKIDGYIAEVPAAKSAVKSNSNLTYVEFEEGHNFEATMEDASIAVGVKKENTELLDSVNKALSEISVEERETLMEDALVNQPLSN